MITEIIFFKPRPDIDVPGLVERYERTAGKWAQNPGLLHKWYFYDEATREGGDSMFHRPLPFDVGIERLVAA
ncbi:hypothetical protein G3N57_01715 [Paraburkholderia sp. Se-20369]|nr:hypothetical protein [Paraburkholderia sp. Se-20369]